MSYTMQICPKCLKNLEWPLSHVCPKAVPSETAPSDAPASNHTQAEWEAAREQEMAEGFGAALDLSEAEVLAEHGGGERREWHVQGAWLYPGDRIIVQRNAEQRSQAPDETGDRGVSPAQASALPHPECANGCLLPEGEHCAPGTCWRARLDYKSPATRSAAAFPADVRRVLESSNIPIAQATAIADRLELVRQLNGALMNSEGADFEISAAFVREIIRALTPTAAPAGETPRYVGGFCQDREKCVARNAELAALRSDAERYRWLRLNADEIDAAAVEWARKYGNLPAQLDDAIDAARTSKEAGKNG